MNFLLNFINKGPVGLGGNRFVAASPWK